MGLDMYLNRRSYICGKDESKIAEVTAEDFDGTIIKKKFDKVKYVIQEVGYWRKANAIHKWFVDNVQDGNDDCRSYDVSKNDLETLRELCLKALKYKEKVLELRNSIKLNPDDEITAEELTKLEDELSSILPSQSGFFFGSTNYDDWYFEDLENTVEIIDKIFEEDPNCDEEYYYHSSW